MIFLLIVGLRINLLLSLVLIIPMGVDGTLQYLGLIKSTNTRRFITGLLGGFGIIGVYYFVIDVVLSLLGMNFG
jgi:uncharacterized membrane protein